MKPDRKDYENTKPMEESGASKAAGYEHVDRDTDERTRHIAESVDIPDSEIRRDPVNCRINPHRGGVLIPPEISGSKITNCRVGHAVKPASMQNADGDHFISAFWAKNGAHFRVIDGELFEVQEGHNLAVLSESKDRSLQRLVGLINDAEVFTSVQFVAALRGVVDDFGLKDVRREAFLPVEPSEPPADDYADRFSNCGGDREGFIGLPKDKGSVFVNNTAGMDAVYDWIEKLQERISKLETESLEGDKTLASFMENVIASSINELMERTIKLEDRMGAIDQETT